MKQSNSNSNGAVSLAGWLATFALTLSTNAKTPVELPAGSIDGLAAAVASAGPGGTVLVKGGTHLESGTVLVGLPVSIIGEVNAVIKSGTSPGGSFPIELLPTIHIRNTARVTVQGLSFEPAGSSANSAVLIENSPGVRVLDNTITSFQYGVVIQHGDNALIQGNTISGNSANAGVLVINGASVEITENTVSGEFFGLFASDREGRMLRNHVSGCSAAIILCHSPAGVLTISGNLAAAETFCARWVVEGNISTGSQWGYVVIDSSHDNVLVNNAAAGNSDYDIELAGDTARYTPLPPLALACHDNVLVAGSQKGLIVKDCGNNNAIRGDVTLLDNTIDPCD